MPPSRSVPNAPASSVAPSAATLTTNAPAERVWAEFLPPTSLDATVAARPTLNADLPVVLDEMLVHAAKLLRSAHRPVVVGGLFATCEAQTVMIRLAERIGALFDGGEGHTFPARGGPLHHVGEARTTRGELRHDADLLIFVGCALARTAAWLDRTAPRTAQRFTLNFAPAEAAPLDTQTIQLADAAELLRRCTALRAAAQTSAADAEPAPSEDFPEPSWRALLQMWRQARLPVIIYDQRQLSRTLDSLAAATIIETLEGLVMAHAREGRAVAVPLGRTGNSPGLEYVLTARTGYPDAVDFASGRAEHAPWRTSVAAALARDEVDCVLDIGGWWSAAESIPAHVPVIAFREATAPSVQARRVEIATPAFPVGESGTLLRSDGVSLIHSGAAPDAGGLETLLSKLLTLIG